jgi:small-conductance mechanosensitive channel
MKPDGTSGNDNPSELAGGYWRLVSLRHDINRHIGMLRPQDSEWEELWLRLEGLVEAMHTKLIALANSPASDLQTVAAKAAILHALLQPDETIGCTADQADIKALTLSITVDIAQLAGT